MAYETKTTLAAVYDVLETSKTLEEAKIRVARIANVEGVILRPTGVIPEMPPELPN
ncbi:MAG: hypothetical protein FWD35_05625 [Oscillospiraceae bacterium]|nr:hypothetical protein [Oscillospiraceae bacterium]